MKMHISILAVIYYLIEELISVGDDDGKSSLFSCRAKAVKTKLKKL